MPSWAIVTAAGEGRRMGEDKGLLELGGKTALEHVVEACRLGGVDSIVVVRHVEARPLPAAVSECVRVALVAERGEMIDSLRAGVRAVVSSAAPASAPVDALLVFPVDHPLAGQETVAAVLARLGSGGAQVVLPLWRDRPGHPIALAAALADEVLAPGTVSLRDVVTADPARVAAVPVRNSWVRRDLDTPEDLDAARRWLDDRGLDDRGLDDRNHGRRR